jgi:hypothetical protein
MNEIRSVRMIIHNEFFYGRSQNSVQRTELDIFGNSRDTMLTHISIDCSYYCENKVLLMWCSGAVSSHRCIVDFLSFFEDPIFSYMFVDFHFFERSACMCVFVASFWGPISLFAFHCIAPVYSICKGSSPP